jgi:hypothetical protein
MAADGTPTIFSAVLTVLTSQMHSPSSQTTLISMYVSRPRFRGRGSRPRRPCTSDHWSSSPPSRNSSKRRRPSPNLVSIVPKFTNIRLQIFVTCRFYIFVTFHQSSLVGHVFKFILSQLFEKYLSNWHKNISKILAGFIFHNFVRNFTHYTHF